MNEHGKVPSHQETVALDAGQMMQLSSAIAQEIPRVGVVSHVQQMMSRSGRRDMRNVLRLLVEPKDEVAVMDEKALLDWHAGWPRFWRAFGLKYDHEALILPEYRTGFGWSIVTPCLSEWPTSRLLHEVCGRMFPTWQFYDDGRLDKIISAQEPVGVHVVLVRNGIEADEIHQAKSAVMIETAKIPAITIRQRQVLEARYYLETNEHLDISNTTICAGSRYAGGHVPYAYWHDVQFCVCYVYPDRASGGWRVRETVSLPAQA